MAAKMNGKPERIGQNVEALLHGSELTLRIDLAAPRRPSKSGKSEIIATTSGAAFLIGPDGARIAVNLNLYQ